MLKGKTKLTKIGNSKFILVPTSMITDSAFPFKENRYFNIEIVDNKLIIS